MNLNPSGSSLSDVCGARCYAGPGHQTRFNCELPPLHAGPHQTHVSRCLTEWNEDSECVETGQEAGHPSLKGPCGLLVHDEASSDMNWGGDEVVSALACTRRLIKGLPASPRVMVALAHLERAQDLVAINLRRRQLTEERSS